MQELFSNKHTILVAYRWERSKLLTVQGFAAFSGRTSKSPDPFEKERIS
jgi:hypothetical protein